MRWITTVLAISLAASAAQGQDATQAVPSNVHQSLGSMGLWDAEVMMEQAAINIARRYNLDAEQEDYTRRLLKKRTREFLTVYEDDMRALLKELFMQQLGGKTPDGKQARAWGERAVPLLEAAKKAILDGNMEWRDVLNDEQKKIHDLDLRLMDQNFRTLEQRFQRWQQGEFRATDWMGGTPPRTNRQANASRPEKFPHPVGAKRSEDYWELYVKKFIRDYQLDEAQKNSALAILKDAREKAVRVRQKTEGRRKSAQAELQRLVKEKAPPAKIREWSRQRRELDRPITDLFQELKGRLAKIPTEAQRRRVPDDYISEPPASQPAIAEKKADTQGPAKADAPPTPPAEQSKPPTAQEETKDKKPSAAPAVSSPTAKKSG